MFVFIDAPTEIIFPKETGSIAYLGKKATITCKANGYPEPTYRLYHNGTQLAHSGGVYSINSVKLDDSGGYKCVANNSLGIALAVFTLTVPG